MDQVLEVLQSYNVLTIVGLILLDFVFGVAVALKTNKFEWAKVANFYQTSVVPYVLGYVSLKVVFDYFIVVDNLGSAADWLNPTLVGVMFLTLVGKLVASIFKNFSQLIPQE